MKLSERYGQKKPALLIVPDTVTSKKGWLKRLENSIPNLTERYLFRIITKRSDVCGQIRSLNSKYSTIVFVNNPLDDYSEVVKIATNGTRLPLAIDGYQIFRKRNRNYMNVPFTSFNRWGLIVNENLNKDLT